MILSDQVSKLQLLMLIQAKRLILVKNTVDIKGDISRKSDFFHV